MKAEPGAEAREIHYEETAWKARPDFSPDGKRIVYASYLGQQWHQLWVLPSEGGDAFPLSYGDFDNVAPRWSPDGKQIAFISNRSGNTSLWTQTVPGGAQTELVAKEKHYLKPMGQLGIAVLDEAGHPTAARVFVVGEDKRAYAPDDAWMNADDNFVRSERPFEVHYFHTAGNAELTASCRTRGRRSDEGLRIPFRAADRHHNRRAKIESHGPSSATRPSQGGRLAVGQRGCSRAHELWRRISQHTQAPGNAGGG